MRKKRTLCPGVTVQAGAGGQRDGAPSVQRKVSGSCARFVWPSHEQLHVGAAWVAAFEKITRTNDG